MQNDVIAPSTNAAAPSSVMVQFKAESGESFGPTLELPLHSSLSQLESVIVSLKAQNAKKATPNANEHYAFYLDAAEIHHSIAASLEASAKAQAHKKQKTSAVTMETTLAITFCPLDVYRVKPVGRCIDTLVGHADAILAVHYSPDATLLATGGGDFLVRFWSTTTQLPTATARGHKSHILVMAFSPDGKYFVSGDRSGILRAWEPRTGKAIGQPMKGHRQWITSLAWEPHHMAKNGVCERVISASKCGAIKCWNVRTGSCLASFSGHTDSVESVIWGGAGTLYSASRDRSVKVWAIDAASATTTTWNGKLIRTLVGHAHRLNFLALNVSAALRSGPFAPGALTLTDTSSPDAIATSLQKYQTVLSATGGQELLISCSDDFTMILWHPLNSKQPIARMTGHVQPVTHVVFSPNGKYIASASFDKKVKLWHGSTGAFVATCNGHVGAVYQVAWSSDSRYLVSASKDGTVKLWDYQTPATCKATLPGHADEVYALDWSPNGVTVASGSKDRTIKIWQH